MKPPSYLISQNFTFDEELFVGSDCEYRTCINYNPKRSCAKCICFTRSEDDYHYDKFANILVKEVP